MLVECSHRRDEEGFYLPCVWLLDRVKVFLGADLGWLYDYHYGRVHSGYGLWRVGRWMGVVWRWDLRVGCMWV